MADGLIPSWGVVRLAVAGRGRSIDRRSAECGLSLWGSTLVKALGLILRDSKIPFSFLSPRPGPGSRWGLNLGVGSSSVVGGVSLCSSLGSTLVVATEVEKEKGNTTNAEDRNRATRVDTTDPQCTSLGPRASARRLVHTFKFLFSD